MLLDLTWDIYHIGKPTAIVSFMIAFLSLNNLTIIPADIDRQSSKTSTTPVSPHTYTAIYLYR